MLGAGFQLGFGCITTIVEILLKWGRAVLDAYDGHGGSEGLAVEELAEGVEEASGEGHGGGEGEYPGEHARLRTVLHCRPV